MKISAKRHILKKVFKVEEYMCNHNPECAEFHRSVLENACERNHIFCKYKFVLKNVIVVQKSVHISCIRGKACLPATLGGIAFILDFMTVFSFQIL
jgi:hypothetical protein